MSSAILALPRTIPKSPSASILPPPQPPKRRESRRRSSIKPMQRSTGSYAGSKTAEVPKTGMIDEFLEKALAEDTLLYVPENYVRTGVTVSDRCLQTQPVPEPENFRDVEKTCFSFRKDLETIHQMLKANQLHNVHIATNKTLDTARHHLAEMEEAYIKLMKETRRTCRAQLKTALARIVKSQIEYNATVQRDLERTFEPELRQLEDIERKAEDEMRDLINEEEQLGYQYTRITLGLLNKGILGDKERALVGHMSDRNADLVTRYQQHLSELDDRIFNLRGQLAELDETDDVRVGDGVRRPNTQQDRYGLTASDSTAVRKRQMSIESDASANQSRFTANLVSKRPSIAVSRRESVVSGSRPLSSMQFQQPASSEMSRKGSFVTWGGGQAPMPPMGTIQPGSLQAQTRPQSSKRPMPLGTHPRPSYMSDFSAPSERPSRLFSARDDRREEEGEEVNGETLDAGEQALYENHVANCAGRLEDLEAAHEDEIAALTSSRNEMLEDFKRRVMAIETFHDQARLSAVVQRQVQVLKLALKHKQRRPPVDKNHTVYIGGLTYEMLLVEQQREREAEEKRQRQEEEERRIREEEEERERLEQVRRAEIEAEAARVLAQERALAQAAEAMNAHSQASNTAINESTTGRATPSSQTTRHSRTQLLSAKEHQAQHPRRRGRVRHGLTFEPTLLSTNHEDEEGDYQGRHSPVNDDVQLIGSHMEPLSMRKKPLAAAHRTELAAPKLSSRQPSVRIKKVAVTVIPTANDDKPNKHTNTSVERWEQSYAHVAPPQPNADPHAADALEPNVRYVHMHDPKDAGSGADQDPHETGAPSQSLSEMQCGSLSDSGIPTTVPAQMGPSPSSPLPTAADGEESVIGITLQQKPDALVQALPRPTYRDAAVQKYYKLLDPRLRESLSSQLSSTSLRSQKSATSLQNPDLSRLPSASVLRPLESPPRTPPARIWSSHGPLAPLTRAEEALLQAMSIRPWSAPEEELMASIGEAAGSKRVRRR
ncbi:uncharacterized protein EV422DRAFT_97700 [Fimicolochytrium jonesii]|uniref:uncharacterized protein n=1 Tax=Fimicolochytrium jonesii TaxID=1396493 RepID=UPI0022FDEA6C|nr:uncharacterized protein EV422DRAFT_97700 [Fimicolochytrium jonesii]KAI8819580.1 hypothetical protein EV422DRAFT_97700 [Fimicolochytrium jonesii]